MTLRGAHVAGLCASAALCAAAVLVSAGATPATLLLAVLAPAAAAFGKRGSLPAWCTQSLAAPGLGAVMMALALGLRGSGSLSLIDGCACVLALMVARLATARFPSHDGQALLLGTLLVCAATVLSPSIALAPVLLLYVVALTSTLVTRQLSYDLYLLGFASGDAGARERQLGRRDVLTLPFFGAIAALATLLVAAGLAVFVGFPRSGAPSRTWPPGAGSMPDSVSLTSAPRALGAGRPLARVLGLSATTFARGLYLRGDVYDAWQDGAFHSGARSGGDEDGVADGAAPGAMAQSYTVRCQSDVFRYLPTLGPVWAGRVVGSGFVRPVSPHQLPVIDSMLPSGDPQPLQIVVQGPLWPRADDGAAASACAAPRAADVAVQWARELPAGLDARIAPLARQIVAGAATAAGRAARLRRYLATQATYSLTPSGAGQADPLADFLFGGKTGHCEYFSTAYALMLRAVGVPARVVGGLAFGAWDPSASTVVFRGSHAHAWVEWWEPCAGWQLDDATPPMAGETLRGLAALTERFVRLWDEQVMGFGPEQQLAALGGAARLFEWTVQPVRLLLASWTWPSVSLLGGGLAASAALLLGLLLRAPQRQRFEQQMADALRTRLEIALARRLLPGETFQQAAAQLDSSAGALRALIDAYEAQRFGGGAPLPAAQARAMLAAARAGAPG